MQKPEFHIFVCASFRAGGEQQGVCGNKDAIGLLQYIENEIMDRGVDALVSSTGCLKLCEKGPVMVVYPGGDWYGEVTEEQVDKILDALEDGGPANATLLA